MARSDDERFMARALQLAANGRYSTSPNPMVGSVIVSAGGRIIGEGWHRQYGGPHAEVNAVNSVADADRPLLPESTIYVTLEPCSHYGKTPPCAELLVRTGFRRVVTGSDDPNPKVSGRGIAMLRDAGIEVDTGVLREQCDALNYKFLAAHRRGFPWVTLKWACSADGYLDGRFSTPQTAQTVHARRAQADAIVAGAGTILADRPRLDVRLIEGRSPRPVILDRHGLLGPADLDSLTRSADALHITDGRTVEELLRGLYRDFGYISVLVEGGAKVLDSFIESGLWDEAFVEVSPRRISGSVPAPQLPGPPAGAEHADSNTIYRYENR